MKKPFAAALVIGLGLTVLTVAALAQQQSAAPGQPREEKSPYPTTKPSEPGASRGTWLTTPGYAAARTLQTEEAELARQADDFVRQLADARAEADREKIKARLQEVLEKQFDLRQKRHMSEIEALEDQVKKLRELVQKRQENRREILSKRLDQLQREAQGLGW
jgi:hypothetical protein